MNHYVVGDVIDPRSAYDLPRGAAIKRSESGQFVITELPEKSPVEKLRDELVSSKYDAMGPTELAEWILNRFERKQQGDYVLDREGDKWVPDNPITWELQTTYSMVSRFDGQPSPDEDLQKQTLDQIDRNYGISTESPIK
jgi:hypothetical protein